MALGRGKTRVIPGFGLTFGVTIAMLSLLVIIPLAAVFWTSLGQTPEEFLDAITSRRVMASYGVSLSCAFAAALFNAVMGTIMAWVLVRYDFPGKRILDGLVELPFALPTAIAGLALTSLTVNTGWVGQLLAPLGIDVAYTRLGITVALIFVGSPFVVRSVQPVLETLSPQFEEAARVMGASPARVFLRVVFPEIMPAILTGFGLAFARCLGEYGSVIFIAGNMPYSTEITPLLIMSQLQEYDYAAATAIAIVMLVASFLILLVMNVIQIRAARRTSVGR